MDTHFDVLILGTGLTQSITAAALSKTGLKVVHIDSESYYGGDQASLTQEELINWHKKKASSNGFLSSTDPLPFSRSYSISLAPSLIPSVGPLIDSVIRSGVARYGRFKLLDSAFIYNASRTPTVQQVPGSKEDIFRARDISLIDKRKLMRFLQFASGDFESKPELQGREQIGFDTFLKDKFSLDATSRQGILYTLAYCEHDKEPTLPTLVRLRSYIRSVGKYGNSPFLIGHYGGLGELAQGFCRASAVNGGVYILGHRILSLKLPDESQSLPASIELEGVPDILTADIVITDQKHLLHAGNIVFPPQSACQYACAILVLNKPMNVPIPKAPEGEDRETSLDSCIVTFPPGSLSNGFSSNVVRALQTGQETLSCPSGKYILYMSTKLDDSSASHSPKDLLQPYLDAIVQPDEVEFSCFYTTEDFVDSGTSGDQLRSSEKTLIAPQLSSSWTEMGDLAVKHAESLFHAATGLKNWNNDGDSVPFWPPIDRDDNDNDSSSSW